MKRAGIFTGAVVVLIAVGVTAGSATGCESGAATSTTVPAAVQADSVVADGTVLPQTRAELAFAAAGRVKTVSVEEGATVTAGQILATLDDTAARAAAEAAQADADVAKAGLEQAKAAVDTAKAAVDKAKAVEDGLSSGASGWRFDAADADIAAAEAQLASAQAGVQGAEAALAGARARVEQAQAVLADLTLAAPFAGTVVDVAVTSGDEVTPAVVAVRVADLSAWEIETTDLSEASLALVSEGSQAELTFDALPGVSAQGKVSAVGRLGAPYQGTIVFPVTVVPDPPIEGLRWGLTATVRIAVR
jgi:RND family efflux transporter MFP subunit